MLLSFQVVPMQFCNHMKKRLNSPTNQMESPDGIFHVHALAEQLYLISAVIKLALVTLVVHV